MRSKRVTLPGVIIGCTDGMAEREIIFQRPNKVNSTSMLVPGSVKYHWITCLVWWRCARAAGAIHLFPLLAAFSIFFSFELEPIPLPVSVYMFFPFPFSRVPSPWSLALFYFLDFLEVFTGDTSVALSHWPLSLQLSIVGLSLATNCNPIWSRWRFPAIRRFRPWICLANWKNTKSSLDEGLLVENIKHILSNTTPRFRGRSRRGPTASAHVAWWKPDMVGSFRPRASFFPIAAPIGRWWEFGKAWGTWAVSCSNSEGSTSIIILMTLCKSHW